MPTPYPDIHFLPFLDGAALFHAGTQRLWVLNSTVAFIWCALEAHSSLESLAQGMAKTFHLNQDHAKRDIRAAIEEMSSEGLFEGFSPQCVSPERAWQDLLAPQGPAPVGAPAYSHQLNFYNVKVWLAIADSVLLDEMLRIYAFFMADDDENLGDSECKSAAFPKLLMTVLPTEGGLNHFDVFINNQRLDCNISRERVIPYLVTAIFQKVSKHIDGYLVFHGAALTRNGDTLIFPAHSGAGKSTLCAALLAKEWDCLSDELAIIEPEQGWINPMPLPMSIKPGSIDPLRRDYPGLSGYPLHNRADGKQVRYLPITGTGTGSSLATDTSLAPGAPMASCEDRYKLTSIVLPKYLPDEETTLSTIDKVQVLEKMAETGSSERPLTNQDIQGLVSIIERTPCYCLSYGSTDAAAEVLGAFVDEHH